MAPKALGLPAPILFLRDRFGGDFEVSDGEVTAPTTGIKLVGNDPEAVELVFVNLGTDTVFIRPKGAATSTAGIPLLINGVGIFNVRDDGILPTLDWYATANSGAQDVYFLRLSRFNQVEQA